MKRDGKTATGVQRWYCYSCHTSTTHRIDTTAKDLASFLDWLLSRKRQADLPGAGRTFRRKIEKCWNIWPIAPVTGEVCRVVYVDGIYIARNLVVLIACNDLHVLSWYMARSENSSAWTALLSRIPTPDLVVTDGGVGFAKAVKKLWPNTLVQRCLFHVFCQVKGYITSHPKLPAGVELYGLSKELLHVKTLKQADMWVQKYQAWVLRWEDFLLEKTIIEGREFLTHDRLIKARNGLNRLVSAGTLFNFLDPELTKTEPLPATNNRIEGGINALLRQMLRDHRGLSKMRRVKAVFWWCYMHTECPASPAEILKSMPTDRDIERLYQIYARDNTKESDSPSWGDAIVWEDFHTSEPYWTGWD